MMKYLILFIPLWLLSACGGGGSSSSGLTISGVAATGAAISGGTVEVTCANGTGTGITNVNGTYTVTILNGIQPCILRATDPISKIQLHSVLESGATTANITPITDLVVANALGDAPATLFANFSAAAQAKVNPANIATAVTRIQALTASLGADADLSGIDVMKGTMVAASAKSSGDAIDKKIDALMAALSAADKKITDLSAQVKTLTSTANVSSIVNSVIGDAQYGLANCPYARTGDFWVLDFLGSAPQAWNANFNTMVLKRVSDNSTYSINLKRDAKNNPIACAFTSTIGSRFVEYRVSPGGVGVWAHDAHFGIFVPVQKTKTLTDLSFSGTYPSLGFIQAKGGSLRLGLPMNFEVKSDGSIKAFYCDLTKTLPDCASTIDTTTADPVTCTALSDGTLSCSSPGGISATAVLYLTGSQATLFMSVTNMNVGSAAYGGLIALTKAPELQLPEVGTTTEAESIWLAGVQPGGNAIVTEGNLATRIESVDPVAKTAVSSFSGSSITATSYLNVPAKGFVYVTSNGYKSIAMGSQSGWGLQISKSPTGTFYDGWSAVVKMK